jgi:hypothetical protein
MQQAPDCDMVLAHDDDLVMVNGIGHGTVSGLLNSSYTLSSHVDSHWRPSNLT